MKAKSCFEESSRERYDRLCAEVCGRPLKANPDPLGLSNALVLVEVEGGMVQNVSLQNPCAQPILVLVRDHDNHKADPEDYRDDEWLLTAREG